MADQTSNQQGLRPMESAPKSGEVLLKVKERAGVPGKWLVGHHMQGGHSIEDHPPIEGGWYFWNGRMFDRAAEPIGWMPLPDETSPTLVWQCCDVWYGPAREACPICKTPRGAVITAATRRQAPWNDFSGNTIFEGDEIVHPTGERGRVLYVEGCTYPNDAWRVDYADGGPAGRLCLQTGDKGRAVVAAKAAPEEPPPNLGPREPDNDMVICPNCTNQFPAMSVNAQKERSQAEKDLTQAFEERDGYHAYADQLTAMIGVYFETDHGEHSSGNFPWENAIETMRVAIGGKGTAAQAVRLLRAAHSELALDPDNSALAARIAECLASLPQNS